MRLKIPFMSINYLGVHVRLSHGSSPCPSVRLGLRVRNHSNFPYLLNSSFRGNLNFRYDLLSNKTSICYYATQINDNNSSNPEKKISNYFIFNILSNLQSSLYEQGSKSNLDLQKEIEALIINKHDNPNNITSFLHNINYRLIDSKILKFWLEKQVLISQYIDKLVYSLEEKIIKTEDIFLFSARSNK